MTASQTLKLCRELSTKYFCSWSKIMWKNFKNNFLPLTDTPVIFLDTSRASRIRWSTDTRNQLKMKKATHEIKAEILALFEMFLTVSGR